MNKTILIVANVAFALLLVFIVVGKMRQPNVASNQPVTEIPDFDPTNGNGVEPEQPEEPEEPEKPEEMPAPTTYQEAIKASEATGKKIVLYFTAPAWCPPCQRMESETLPNPLVQDALKSYIFYKIDIDKGEKSVASRWKVRGVPTYVITDSKEKLHKTSSGFKPPETFANWLGTL